MGLALAPYTKFADVKGIKVLAYDSVPNMSVLHVAHVLAQWLDNDEDGNPDNDVYAALLLRGAHMYFTGDKVKGLTDPAKAC